jgi:hypothetical protein
MNPQDTQLACSIAAVVTIIILLIGFCMEKRKNRHLRTKNMVASQTITSLAGLIDLIKIRAPGLAADSDVKRISDQTLAVVNAHRARLVSPSPELELLAKDLEMLAGLEQRQSKRLYREWSRVPQVVH